MLSIQLALLLLFSCVHFVKGAGRFTTTPPSVLYVSEGGIAKFTWDYQVDNRARDFSVHSPKWFFYQENATYSKEYEIGFDNKTNSWKWEIAKDCPPRLKIPTTRVSKESNATLVISNVTTADNGGYECQLVFKLLPTEKSKSQLIVVVPPQVNISGETNVTEYTNLTLVCSAVGPPTPKINVTWINSKTGVALGQGEQSSTLFIANITREQNGTNYTCKAKNHPLKPDLAVQEVVTVTVKFPPESCNYCSKVEDACPGKKVVIKCFAISYPPPKYYWYNPLNDSETGVKSEIEVSPIQGNWTSHITNGIGKGIDCNVPMKVLHENDELCRHVPEKCLDTGEIVGIVIGVLVGVGIIAVIGVVVYKKVKKDDKRISLKALVLIIIGVLVASGIIVAIIVAILDECMKAGLLVGITLGVVVGVGIIAVIGVVIYIKKKKD